MPSFNIISMQVRNLRIGAMMRTVLPALAQAVVFNSSPNFYHEGKVENLKEKLQVNFALFFTNSAIFSSFPLFIGSFCWISPYAIMIQMNEVLAKYLNFFLKSFIMKVLLSSCSFLFFIFLEKIHVNLFNYLMWAYLFCESFGSKFCFNKKLLKCCLSETYLKTVAVLNWELNHDFKA